MKRKKHEYKWEPNSIRNILKTVSVDKTMVDLKIPHYEDICQAMADHGLFDDTDQHGKIVKTPEDNFFCVFGLTPKGEELWDAIQDEESWHEVRFHLAFPDNSKKDKAAKAARVISQIMGEAT